MAGYNVLFLGLLLTSAICSVATTAENAKDTCDEIDSKISDASAVIYATNTNFTSDIHHWFASSSQVPACVLEAGSAEDTAAAIKIIGNNKTPFAVQSGGHSSNPGFSSTGGVHISLQRLNQVILSDDKKTVTIGTGLTWADIYKELDGSGVNVVGGRTPGPGVGGFTLGGGFSWKTNQYGLTCDTVKSFTLVFPNGTITTVDSSQPGHFFALKGGLNRFGIVTHIVYRTHTQSDLVYGGFNLYTPDETPAILNATLDFYHKNKDPKAQIITTLSASLLGTSALVIFFYDGPGAPSAFAPFDTITPLTLLPNLRTQSFASFVSGIPSKVVVNPEGKFDTLSTQSLTGGFVEAVKAEADKYSDDMLLHGGLMVSFDIEPFLSSYGGKATDSAYPHTTSPLPLNVYFAWADASENDFWNSAIHSSVQRLKQVAMDEGIYCETKYPNYAIKGTSAGGIVWIAECSAFAEDSELG